MKLSGIQYYWIIALALVLQLVLAYPIAIFEPQIKASVVLKVIVLIALLPIAACYFAVILEIWSVFGTKAIVYVALLCLLAVLVHPYFALLGIVTPHIYWGWRINGIPANAKST